MSRTRSILVFLACAAGAAAGGIQASSASVQDAREQVKPLPPPRPADRRLFLNLSQSELAATDGIVPEGTRSILNVRTRLRYGQFVWEEAGIGSGPLAVRVDLDRQLISVFRGGHEIGTAVILYGAHGHDTPQGRFPILTKLEKHRSATYDAPMPFTLRLTNDGVALHGSEVRRGAATHGCIGVPLEFARRLFGEASVGDVVVILGGNMAKSAPSAGRVHSTTS